MCDVSKVGDHLLANDWQNGPFLRAPYDGTGFISRNSSVEYDFHFVGVAGRLPVNNPCHVLVELSYKPYNYSVYLRIYHVGVSCASTW